MLLKLNNVFKIKITTNHFTFTYVSMVELVKTIKNGINISS